MRRGRIFIFLALILIIGLAVVAFVFRQTFTPEPDVVQVATVEVYIAAQNIPQGETIVEELLKPVRIPQDLVVSVMFTTDQRDAIIGKIAKFPIDQGVFISTAMVSDGDLASGGPSWASQIPQGMTAISIPTTRLESVAYGVQDGAHVNVSACFLFVDVDPAFQTQLPNLVSVLTAAGGILSKDDRTAEGTLTLGVFPLTVPQGRTEVESAFQQGIYLVPAEGQRPRLVCQMIVQNAVVLKFGNFTLPNIQTPDPNDPNAPPVVIVIPDIATLVVTPQDSVTLSYLVYSGAKISMTLRNASDDSRVATEAATLQLLLSQYNIPVPAKLPYSMQPRVDQLITPLLPPPPPPPPE